MSSTAAFLNDLYSSTPFVQATRIQRGFPAEVFTFLAEKLNLTETALVVAVGLSERTMRDKKSTKATLDVPAAERAFRVYRVFRAALDAFSDEQTARSWLVTEQRALNCQRPITLLSTDIGTDLVLSVLGSIKEGVYL